MLIVHKIGCVGSAVRKKWQLKKFVHGGGTTVKQFVVQ